jgi:hypothetical protein
VVIAMPESFDSLLAEMADAATAGLGAPDPAAARSRARQRTLRRRTTASALVLALLCASGTGYAVLDHHAGRTDDVHALDVPGPSAGSGGASPTPTQGGGTGAASPTPFIGGSGSGASAYSAIAGVWQATAQGASYLMVFPDGLVGLSSLGGFPLCTARLGETGATSSPSGQKGSGGNSSSVAANAARSAAVGSDPTASMAASGNSTATAVPGTTGLDGGSALPLTQVSCDLLGTLNGMVLSETDGSKALTISGPLTKTSSGKPDFTAVYTRVLDLGADPALSATGPGAEATLAKLVGEWKSADDAKGGETGRLAVDKNGAVTYSVVPTGGKPIEGSGAIDGYFTAGIRVLTKCDQRVGADPLCGVFLITLGPVNDEITVYTGYGPEVFVHGG